MRMSIASPFSAWTRVSSPLRRPCSSARKSVPSSTMQRALVGHEELEARDAPLRALRNLGHDAVRQIGDREMEAVVDRRLALRLGGPEIERLAQCRALRLDGEVDMRRRAAKCRRPMPGEEVIRGDRAAEGHLQMGMHINPAGDDVLAARVNRRITGEAAANRDDLLVLDQHIRPIGIARGDDRAALDYCAHGFSSPPAPPLKREG